MDPPSYLFLMNKEWKKNQKKLGNEKAYVFVLFPDFIVNKDYKPQMCVCVFFYPSFLLTLEWINAKNHT